MKNDILIIGAGPGGLSCAKYLRRLGLSSTVIYDCFGGKQNFYKEIFGLYPDDKVMTEDFLQKEKEGIYDNNFSVPIHFEKDKVLNVSQELDGSFKILLSNKVVTEVKYLVVASGTKVFLPQSLPLGSKLLSYKNYPFSQIKQEDKVLVLGAGYTSSEIIKILFDKNISEITVVDINSKNYQLLATERRKAIDKYSSRLIFSSNYDLLNTHIIIKDKYDKQELIRYDHIICCTGELPNTDFLPQKILSITSKKILIDANSENPNMSIKWNNLFAVGDVKNSIYTSFVNYVIADGIAVAQNIYKLKNG